MGWDPDPMRCGRCNKDEKVRDRIYCRECRLVLTRSDLSNARSPLRSPGGTFYYPPPDSPKSDLFYMLEALRRDKK